NTSAAPTAASATGSKTSAETGTTSAPLHSTTTAPPSVVPEPAEPTLQADLVGRTDLDLSHWRPSDAEPDQAFNLLAFDTWDHVYEFAVTMNVCATRQLRVAWSSGDTPVVAGVSDFRDGWDDSLVEPDPVAAPSQSGTLILNSCEQPAFR